LVNGVDLIVDGGVRDKKQQAGFFGPLPTIPFNYVDSHLQTWSITPRLSVKNVIFGMPSGHPDRRRLLRRGPITQSVRSPKA
jgi:iron complex outermembrane receptor protein